MDLVELLSRRNHRDGAGTLPAAQFWSHVDTPTFLGLSTW